jgi:hypothetical protein
VNYSSFLAESENVDTCGPALAMAQRILRQSSARVLIAPPPNEDIWAYRAVPIDRAGRAVQSLRLGRAPEDDHGS